LQMATGFFRLHCSCLQHDDAGDNLKTVGDTMFQLLQEHLFLTYQIILFVFEDAFVGNVLNAKQDCGVRTLETLRAFRSVVRRPMLGKSCSTS